MPHRHDRRFGDADADPARSAGEHSVDREEYLRRDREIQHALERMATKDELRDVNDTLRSIQESISPRRR